LKARCCLASRPSPTPESPASGRERLLTPADFRLPATTIAPALLGATIIAGAMRARIVETEAYQGVEDLACHASRGLTPRTSTLFGPCGVLYVYLCYGVHAMLNLVCDAQGVPAAVLIRAVAIESAIPLARRRRHARPGSRPEDLANGPGRLTQALGIGLSHHGLRLSQAGCPIAIARGPAPAAISCGARVGVAYAREWALKPWRFWETGYRLARPDAAAGAWVGNADSSADG